MTAPTLTAPGVTPPDIVRCAYAELVVTDLAASRAFYVDVLGLTVTEEDDERIYLRTLEEFIHHNLVLTKGPVAAAAALAFRVRTPGDVDLAEAYYAALGCRTERKPQRFRRGASATRCASPTRLAFRTSSSTRSSTSSVSPGAMTSTRRALSCASTTSTRSPPTCRAGLDYLEGVGFRVTEDIQDDNGVTYAAWMRRKDTVHDTALTGGNGPRLHHVAFSTHEKHNILAICDKLGALRMSDVIERGPGRHGVSNAFYLYILDPDGHRIEIYTQDYYTGDPDNPVVTWDVHDNQRRDWWGNPVVPSWYTEASLVLDLDGVPQPLIEREEPSEQAVTVGADGFSYTRKGDVESGLQARHAAIDRCGSAGPSGSLPPPLVRLRGGSCDCGA